MTEIKELDTVYLEEYDVKVTPYLSYAQIQQIVNRIAEVETWSERQADIDLLLLAHITNITPEELQKVPHELLLKSGLIDAVKSRIKNLDVLDDAIRYTTSFERNMAIIIKQIAPKIQKMVSKDGKPSKK